MVSPTPSQPHTRICQDSYFSALIAGNRQMPTHVRNREWLLGRRVIPPRMINISFLCFGLAGSPYSIHTYIHATYSDRNRCIVSMTFNL